MTAPHTLTDRYFAETIRHGGIPARRGDAARIMQAVHPLASLARAILDDGPKAAVGEYNRDKQAEWTRAAQDAVDGDPAELEWLDQQLSAWEAFGEYAYAAEMRRERVLDFELWLETTGRGGLA